VNFKRHKEFIEQCRSFLTLVRNRDENAVMAIICHSFIQSTHQIMHKHIVKWLVIEIISYMWQVPSLAAPNLSADFVYIHNKKTVLAAQGR